MYKFTTSRKIYKIIISVNYNNTLEITFTETCKKWHFMQTVLYNSVSHAVLALTIILLHVSALLHFQSILLIDSCTAVYFVVTHSTWNKPILSQTFCYTCTVEHSLMSYCTSTGSYMYLVEEYWFCLWEVPCSTPGWVKSNISNR